MPFIKNQISRQRLKRTATSGLTPTIGPSYDHTDGTWTDTEIYPGEFYWNMGDQQLWLGWMSGSTSGVTLINGGAGGTYTADNGLTENPANNFQLGGPLITDTYIDGASNTYGIELQDLTFFRAYTSDVARIDAFQGTTGGRFQLDATSPHTDWTFTDSLGNNTAIVMDGLKMFVKAPGWDTGLTGYYFRLKDPVTGESDWNPLPGSTSASCITDFYVTNIHGCSPITMKDEVICESGLTATTISATTYENLPVSAITAGSNIVVSNTNGNVTISQSNGGTNVIWKDVTLYSSNVAANTLVASQLVPANTFDVADTLEILSTFSGNTPNGTSVSVRLYINTSASLSGAQLLGTFTNTVGTNQYTGFYRHAFITATGTTGTLFILNSSVSQATSITFNNTASSIVTINTTIDQYLIFSIQVANTIYTHQIRGINVKIIR